MINIIIVIVPIVTLFTMTCNGRIQFDFNDKPLFIPKF